MLHKLSFAVESHQYFVLLGKTGSGKTLLLESIAGLHPIEGTVRFDGADITRLPPEKRHFGFVYQDFALFSNMNVHQNIRYASRYKIIENANKLFDDLVGFLDLGHLLDRPIHHLSGGERQRVAIARAVYSRPRLLLLDEPLSAVDPTFRNAIMKSLKEIVHRYDTSIIHVTHNFREASYLADTIAVILDGKMLQIGPAKEVLEKPNNIDVARFLGFKNIFSTSLLGFEQHNRYFSIDPNTIVFSNEPADDGYSFPCIIEKIMGITDHYKVFARVEDALFFAKVPRHVFDRLKLHEGSQSYIRINKKEIAFL